jgi:hypothetical protein
MSIDEACDSLQHGARRRNAVRLGRERLVVDLQVVALVLHQVPKLRPTEHALVARTHVVLERRHHIVSSPNDASMTA